MNNHIRLSDKYIQNFLIITLSGFGIRCINTVTDYISSIVFSPSLVSTGVPATKHNRKHTDIAVFVILIERCFAATVNNTDTVQLIIAAACTCVRGGNLCQTIDYITGLLFWVQFYNTFLISWFKLLQQYFIQNLSQVTVCYKNSPFPHG